MRAALLILALTIAGCAATAPCPPTPCPPPPEGTSAELVAALDSLRAEVEALCLHP